VLLLLVRKNLILFLAIGAAFSAFIITYAYSNFASAAVQLPEDSGFTSFQVGSPPTSEEFLAAGGKAYAEVTIADPSGAVEAAPIFQASRGSNVDIPVGIAYRAGSLPFDSITITPIGTTNGFIPAYIAKTSSMDERVAAIQETGKVPGAIELNSLLTYSPQEITVAPNETKEIVVSVNLPLDWPDQMVGEKLWFSLAFAPTNSKITSWESRINQVPFEVDVIG
jgi:hypothetical protein